MGMLVVRGAGINMSPAQLQAVNLVVGSLPEGVSVYVDRGGEAARSIRLTVGDDARRTIVLDVDGREVAE